MEKKIPIYKVMSAVVKSCVRVKVLVFLASHPNDEFEDKEISYRIRSDKVNITGALEGYKERYDPMLALVSLRLVSYKINETGKKRYKITPEGIVFTRKLQCDNSEDDIKISFVCIEENGNTILRSRLEL